MSADMFEEQIIEKVRSISNVDMFSHSKERVHIPPLDSNSLNSLVKSATDYKPKKLGIIVTDRNRPTPVKELLSKILPGLRRRSADVYVVIATGLHPIEVNEVREVVGDVDVNVYMNEVDSEDYVYLGRTKGGIPVMLLDKVVDADSLIFVSSVMPHVWAGFSGGSKLLLPGTSARETILEHHLKYYNHPNALPGCVRGNPFREEIDYVGELISKFSRVYAVNVINSDGNIYGTSGEVKESYLKAVDISKNIYVKEVSDVNYDVLIIDGRPLNMSLYQSVKAVFNNLRISSNDAIIILVSRHLGRCPTGFMEALKSEDSVPEDVVREGVKEVVPHLVAYSLREKLGGRKLIVLTGEECNYIAGESITITNKYDSVIDEVRKLVSSGLKACVIRMGSKYVHVPSKH